MFDYKAGDASVKSAKSVSDIPGFPFRDFLDLQQALSKKRFGIGVDPLAAAEWSDRSGTKPTRIVIGFFSILLLGAALSAIAAAFVFGNYWLLLAVPVMAVTFYASHPGNPAQKWVTVAGALSVVLFIELFVNGLKSGAILVAFAALTFAVVRIVGFINNRAFRKALGSSEPVFVAAYSDRKCTLKENESGKIYSV